MTNPHQTQENRLPGDLTKEAYIERLIRVNHAGEYGAKRIYAGQLAVLGKDEVAPTIEHMAEQEEKHLKFFSDEINKRQVRPTLLMPLWHVAGFALGAVTAAMGTKAAMACTVAVEEVIDAHYAAQAKVLGKDEQSLKTTIEEFREEELEHRDTGIEQHAKEFVGFSALQAVVRRSSKMAIWLSERI
jgi:ubiquinone biosynthesis monooxygenase Coq7